MYHQIKIKGLVQGVGFRPFIYNLAVWMELVGYVTNSAYGVLIVLRATQKQLNLFLHQIDTQKPKLSEIESLEIETIKSNEIFTQFQIKESQNSIELSSKIPTDLAMCQECQDEMEDKNNRRYRYPFISCVNCGPRFSIIKNLPYDRDKTSMDSFVMCKDCEVEYKNPKDRRYHAQPIGCFECGTQLTDENSIESVVASIKDGKIVAIKGVGGYHLVCDATNDVVVQLLRERKQRPSKPFGVMVQNLEVVKTLTYTNEKELELLSSHRRPIVLLKKKESDILSENIAKNIDQIGVFLAPTPLYHLILAKLDRAIVVTSANLSGEPLCKNREDIMKLSYVWDYLLDNNREIINSCDDSVVFVEDEQEFILRGARGYAPTYLKLPNPSPKKLLCLGANQKSTVAICVEERVILSPYIGDLDGVKTIEHFRSNIEILKRVYNFEPEVIICDKHPNYESTKYALELKKENPELELIQVQHHYAHILATMGVNNIKTKVLGVSFDGTGYGDDGNLWGGEFMVCDENSYERVGHFKEFKLLGAEKAIKEPRRVALSFLYEIYGEDTLTLKNSVTDAFSEYELKTLYISWKKSLNTPLSSSCGRLFDCVASLLDIIQIISYEGESALLMESLYDDRVREHFEFSIDNGVIDFSKVVVQIVEESDKQVALSKFFNTLVEIIYQMSLIYNLAVVVSGGVFQNRVLIKLLIEKMPNIILAKGFVTNDSAISYGQAMAFNTLTF